MIQIKYFQIVNNNNQSNLLIKMKGIIMLKKSLIIQAIIFIIAISSFAQENTTPVINIAQPNNDDTIVSQFGESIVFRSKAPIADQYIPVVFIKDPTGQWWPWLNARSLDNTRKNWSLNPVQYGGDNDSGLTFQIQVVLIPRTDIDNGITVSDNNVMFIEAGSQVTTKVFVTKIRKIYPTKSNVITITRQ